MPAKLNLKNRKRNLKKYSNHLNALTTKPALYLKSTTTQIDLIEKIKSELPSILKIYANSIKRQLPKNKETRTVFKLI